MNKSDESKISTGENKNTPVVFSPDDYRAKYATTREAHPMQMQQHKGSQLRKQN